MAIVLADAPEMTPSINQSQNLVQSESPTKSLSLRATIIIDEKRSSALSVRCLYSWARERTVSLLVFNFSFFLSFFRKAAGICVSSLPLSRLNYTEGLHPTHFRSFHMRVEGNCLCCSWVFPARVRLFGDSPSPPFGRVVKRKTPIFGLCFW